MNSKAPLPTRTTALDKHTEQQDNHKMRHNTVDTTTKYDTTASSCTQYEMNGIQTRLCPSLIAQKTLTLI